MPEVLRSSRGLSSLSKVCEDGATVLLEALASYLYPACRQRDMAGNSPTHRVGDEVIRLLVMARSPAHPQVDAGGTKLSDERIVPQSFGWFYHPQLQGYSPVTLG